MHDRFPLDFTKLFDKFLSGDLIVKSHAKDLCAVEFGLPTAECRQHFPQMLLTDLGGIEPPDGL